MLSTKTLIPCGLILLASAGDLATAQTPFSYANPANTARTAAGVYDANNRLIRTLWNRKDEGAGNFNATWDNRDEAGNAVPNGSYQVRVQSNNVRYVWEGGTIGNTSTGTGDNKWQSFRGVFGMATAGNNAYVCLGYAEGRHCASKFLLTNPQSRVDIIPDRATSASSNYVVTDGTLVYWAGYDPRRPQNTFVFASRVSDDGEVTNFASGVAVKTEWGRNYRSTIDNVNTPTATVSGLAVQPTGNYLFVARRFSNSIRVVNKTTGALVRTINTFTAPRNLATQGDEGLWITHGTNSLQRFNVNADGSLSAPTVTISGLLDPLATAVSPNGATITVCDGGGSEQVKAFATATGGNAWTLGQAGGYSTNAAVTNDKFMFWERNLAASVHAVRDSSVNFRPFVSFAPDGSFWVGDGGNYRMLRYAGSDRSYLDYVMYIPHSYNVSVDEADPTRVFCEMLEFAIDYSKPLAPNNGSWRLTRNWKGLVNPNLDANAFNSRLLRSPVTMRNGRTYAFMYNVATREEVLFELVSGGTLRQTNYAGPTQAFWQNVHLRPNGDLRLYRRYNPQTNATRPFYDRSTTNSAAEFSNRALTGFDSDNNPVWASPVVLATIPVLPGEPHDDDGGTMGRQTDSGVLVGFNKSSDNPDAGSVVTGGQYHLAGVKIGSGQYDWKTARSTGTSFTDDFPNDGRFDTGNKSRGSAMASDAWTSGNQIFWNYHGEFWRDAQTNYWNHVSDQGLFVGQFGTWKFAQGPNWPYAMAEMAGNVMRGAVVVGTDGNTYVYHNDEFFHSAVHRWRVDGLNTIRTQTIPVGIGVSVTPAAPTLAADDNANTLAASHPLGNSEILVSENDGAFTAYNAAINVGNVARPAGYWKFKTRAATGRNESAVASSPAFSSFVTPNVIPAVPTLTADDNANTLVAFHPLGLSEILVSENNGAFVDYTTTVNVGNVDRAAGYWKFKVKAATGRNESAVASSPAFASFVAPSVTPAAPALTADDDANALAAAHPLGTAEILVSENDGAFAAYAGTIQVGNVDRAAGYWKFKTRAATGRNESPVVGSPEFTRYVAPAPNVTPAAPTLAADDNVNTLTATHALGNSEILVSENDGAFLAYVGTINVGNVARAAGHWKFKVKAATGRNESAVASSSAFAFFVAPNATPATPTLTGDDNANTLTAAHALGSSEILVSEDSGEFVAYVGTIQVGNVDRAAGYWKFKIRAATGRNESTVVSSPEFTRTAAPIPNVTPATPILAADDNANTLAATHPLGASELLVSENSGAFLAYVGTINVGNVARSAGYWKFKVKAATGRNESATVNSPAFSSFVVVNVTPTAPALQGDDNANLLSAAHPLGTAEILVSEDSGEFVAYLGTIQVSNVDRAAGYWKFKIRAADGRNESTVVSSPEFTRTAVPVPTPNVTPAVPTLTGDDNANTLLASHPLGSSEILVSEDSAEFVAYDGTIRVGNVDRAAGYWKFKIRAAAGRNESVVVSSPEFTRLATPVPNVTPAAPALQGDDAANVLSASHPLSTSEILVSEDSAEFVAYDGTISVGNVDRAAGYWKFKIRSAASRNESAVVSSPEFTRIDSPAPNQPPAVTLTSPANNVTLAVGNPARLRANATDADGTVVRVEFYRDDSRLGEDATAPYTFDWNNAPAGTYQLTARATDNAGATTVSATVTVTFFELGTPPVVNVSPTVAITAPAAEATFTEGNTVTIAVAASDADGQVIRVEYFRDDTKLGETSSAPHTFNWGRVPAGSYQLTARATDNGGATTVSEPVTVVVNKPSATNQAPAVAIKTPLDNANLEPGTTVTIRAEASDADGAVSRVEFFAGSVKLGEATSAPYQVTWENPTDGRHALTARATDNRGATTVSAVVNVAVVPRNRLPLVATGPTTFCAGSSVKLAAPSGFSEYKWSNGETTREITVTRSGTYWVTAQRAGRVVTSLAVGIVVIPTPDKPSLDYLGDKLVASAGRTYRWSLDGKPIGASTREMVPTRNGRYAVTVANAGGCSATSDEVMVETATAPLEDMATNVNLLKTDEVVAYPNPATETLLVSLTLDKSVTANGPVADDGKAYISLADNLGKETTYEAQPVVNRRVRHTLNVSQLKPGMYFLVVRAGGKRFVRKVMKQ